MPNATYSPPAGVEVSARRVIHWLSRRPWAVASFTLALALPALLLHLGRLPLLADEPIRALVALEMHLSHQFFAPTLQGQAYYNKPPLFNWLLVGLFQLAGRCDEWTVRLPTVAALLLYTTAIWRVLRPRLGSRLAFTVALAFATTGRVLFYDSFLGLIDLWQAMLTWLGFMGVWHLGEQRRWAALFGLTYALAAVGFLLKGLPSLVFQGLALLVYFGRPGQWRRLLSWQHALGLAGLGLGLGTYFLLYSRQNSLAAALSVLWDQSSQRTAVGRPLGEVAAYVLLFPFDFIKHFLPWSLLVFGLLSRRARRAVWAVPFLRYNARLFLAGLALYWLSPGTIPRYLFMLVPLGLTVVVPAYDYLPVGPGVRRWLDAGLLSLLILATLAVWAGPLAYLTREVPYAWGWAAGLFAALALGAYLFARLAEFRLLTLGYFLLVLRLAFDVFIFPARLRSFPELDHRAAALRVGRETRGRTLRLLPGTHLDNDAAFYLTRARGQPLRVGWPPPGLPGVLYVAEETQLAGQRYRTIACFELDRGVQFRVVEFEPETL